MSDNRGPDMAVSFGIGLLVGAAAALLFAPQSGEDTRRRIGDLAHGALDKSKAKTDEAKTFLKDQASAVEKAFKEGREAYTRETTHTS